MVGSPVAAAFLIAAAFVVMDHEPLDDRPVVLPDTCAGLSPADARYQFADQGDWRSQLTKEYGGHPLDGRAFAAAQPKVHANLVVVRTDSRDKGDPALGHPPFTQIGDVTCTTHTFQLATSPGTTGTTVRSGRTACCSAGGRARR